MRDDTAAWLEPMVKEATPEMLAAAVEDATYPAAEATAPMPWWTELAPAEARVTAREGSDGFLKLAALSHAQQREGL